MKVERGSAAGTSTFKILTPSASLTPPLPCTSPFCSIAHLQLKKADRGSAAGAASRGSGGGSLSAASLLPVLIVGLLAFLVGHYLQHVPVLSQMLGKQA
jgi:hypothetical protein